MYQGSANTRLFWVLGQQAKQWCWAMLGILHDKVPHWAGGKPVMFHFMVVALSNFGIGENAAPAYIASMRELFAH